MTSDLTEPVANSIPPMIRVFAYFLNIYTKLYFPDLDRKSLIFLVSKDYRQCEKMIIIPFFMIFLIEISIYA